MSSALLFIERQEMRSKSLVKDLVYEEPFGYRVVRLTQQFIPLSQIHLTQTLKI